MKLRPGSLYYGWVVAGASGSIGLANAASAISILTIFVVPMSEEFGWGRTEIAGATTLGAILGAALAPFIGRLVDRFGSRLTLVISGGVIALGCVYLSLMQTLTGFYVAFTVSRIADQGGVKIGTSVAAGKWFQRYRGRATGLVFLVETVGVIVLAPLTQLVIGQWGWRSAWLMLAGLMFVLGVIPCALWVRRQPEDMGLSVDGGPVPAAGDGDGAGSGQGDVVEMEPSLTLGEAARTRVFWVALVSLFLGSNAMAGPGLHLVPYLTERGPQRDGGSGSHQRDGHVGRGGSDGVGHSRGSGIAALADGGAVPAGHGGAGAAGADRYAGRDLRGGDPDGADRHWDQHAGAADVGGQLRARIAGRDTRSRPRVTGVGVRLRAVGRGDRV